MTFSVFSPAALARRREALTFGPHDEPYHFMPSHLPFSHLAQRIREYVEIAVKLPGDIGPLHLDCGVWWEVYASALHAGQSTRLHRHTAAMSVYIVSGVLRFSTGVHAVSMLSAGQSASVSPGATHTLAAEADTVFLSVFSPRLRDELCVQHSGASAQWEQPREVTLSAVR